MASQLPPGPAKAKGAGSHPRRSISSCAVDAVMALKLAGYSNPVVREMIADKHGRVSVETIRNDVNTRLKKWAEANQDTKKTAGDARRAPDAPAAIVVRPGAD